MFICQKLLNDTRTMLWIRFSLLCSVGFEENIKWAKKRYYVSHGMTTFFALSHKFVGLLGSHVCNTKYIWHHSDNNYYIYLSAQSWKVSHHHSFWLDFFFLDVFSPKDASFVKLKATLDPRKNESITTDNILWQLWKCCNVEAS